MQDVDGGRGLVAREQAAADALYLIGSSHPILSEFVRADPGVEPCAFNLEYSRRSLTVARRLMRRNPPELAVEDEPDIVRQFCE